MDERGGVSVLDRAVARGAGRYGPGVRIEAIEVFQVDLPYSGGTYELSGGRTYDGFDATLVRVLTDDGHEGWGESTPFGSNYVAAHARGVRAGIAEVAPALIGQPLGRPDRLDEVMEAALIGHPHVIAALDVACWDALGRSLGIAVCDLLGGRTEGSLPLISSIATGSPEDMRARVQTHRDEGYRGHSIKVGADESQGGPALDAARVAEATADARPGEYFIVDGNGGMTVEGALRFLRQLPRGVDIVLEAPCATWRETESLRRRTDVPIVLDELVLSDASVLRAVERDVADGIGLKVSKNGGLTRCRRHRDLAAAAGLTMSVQDTVGSEIAFAAVLHLAQSVPRRLLRCVLDVRSMVTRSTATFDVELVDGGMSAPDRPGLGLQVDPAALGDPVARYD